MPREASPAPRERSRLNGKRSRLPRECASPPGKRNARSHERKAPPSTHLSPLTAPSKRSGSLASTAQKPEVPPHTVISSPTRAPKQPTRSTIPLGIGHSLPNTTQARPTTTQVLPCSNPVLPPTRPAPPFTCRASPITPLHHPPLTLTHQVPRTVHRSPLTLFPSLLFPCSPSTKLCRSGRDRLHGAH